MRIKATVEVMIKEPVIGQDYDNLQKVMNQHPCVEQFDMHQDKIIFRFYEGHEIGVKYALKAVKFLLKDYIIKDRNLARVVK